MEELDEKKLIVFIPFQLLKLRKAIAKERTPENMEALKRLVQDDIIKEINKNEQVGNITFMEAQKLKSLVLKLYHHIYDEYEELEKAGINDMVEEALVLDIDIIEQRHKEEKEALVLDIDRIEQRHKEEKEVFRMALKGIPMEEISEKTGFSIDELQKILE